MRVSNKFESSKKKYITYDVYINSECFILLYLYLYWICPNAIRLSKMN